jgi:transposase
LFILDEKAHIEAYAKDFYKKIIANKLYDVAQTENNEDANISDYQEVDLNTFTTEQAREVGAEWLVYQALKQLEISQMLEQQGFDEKEIKRSVIHIISRCVYPASEHKTAQWINENSALLDLPDLANIKINKNHLYHISKKLYSIKDASEEFLSNKTNELFDINDTVILYDLTNTYFEGIKNGSEYAKFGRSKEKRSDARLISLALVINEFGFVKYSKIYSGNISDGSTLKKTITDLESRRIDKSTKPTIAMDVSSRVFKTDLSLRPVYHQKDQNVLAHINLGVLAYQMVNTIRYQLKRKNRKHDWKNIVRIMNKQNMVTNSMKNKGRVNHN